MFAEKLGEYSVFSCSQFIPTLLNPLILDLCVYCTLDSINIAEYRSLQQ